MKFFSRVFIFSRSLQRGTKQVRKSGGWVIGGLVVSMLAYGGFEIGNGRTVQNLEGGYELKIPENFEVGRAGKFTEIVAPLNTGTPRSRVLLNVVSEPGVLAPEENKSEWEAVMIGQLSALRKKTVLPTQLHQVETRIGIKPGEVLVIHVEGNPSGTPDGIFEAASQSVDTLKIIEKP